MRVGAYVPNAGLLPDERGIGAMATQLESAGFASLWCADHVIVPRQVRSPYPFSEDGRAPWEGELGWCDAMTSLCFMAAGTQRAEIGSAVMVLPIRHPVLVAKQAAVIDRQSGGRLLLGVGVGWLAEEFAALGVPFETRGSRFEEAVELLRNCWTGSPSAHEGSFYRLPADLSCLPAPRSAPPILVGGVSRAALKRAGRLGDGWIGLQPAARLDVGELKKQINVVRDAAGDAGRDPMSLRLVLRIVESADALTAVARAAEALARIGVDDIVVDTPWSADAAPDAIYARLASAVDGL